jgi:glycosyltransferase involved in cell wall biosynthesis
VDDPRARPNVVVVMPAYNAGRTLKMTYEELPKDTVNLVILVDDGSTDATLEVARQLGLQIFVHNRNYGYGANQKTCYTEALRAGAEIVVMVHPDYQYDPRLLPQIIAPILGGGADVVLGSRIKSEASAASLPASVVYGLRILAVLFWYTLHAWGVRRSRRFDSLRARYRKMA